MCMFGSIKQCWILCSSMRVCQDSNDIWTLFFLINDLILIHSVFSYIEWPLYLFSFMFGPQTFWTPLVMYVAKVGSVYFRPVRCSFGGACAVVGQLFGWQHCSYVTILQVKMSHIFCFHKSIAYSLGPIIISILVCPFSFAIKVDK